MTAKVAVRAAPGSTAVLVGGQPAAARREGAWWFLEMDISSAVEIEVR
jgi:hypothetical protein